MKIWFTRKVESLGFHYGLIKSTETGFRRYFARVIERCSFQDNKLVSDMKFWFSEVVNNFKIKSLLIQILLVSFHSSVLTRQNKTENRE